MTIYYYNIAINNSQVLNEQPHNVHGTVVNVPPGFIDYASILDYSKPSNPSYSVPNDVSFSISKAIANVRWDRIIDSISMNNNIAYIVTDMPFVSNSGNANTPTSQLVFNIGLSHEPSTIDELTEATLTGAVAVRRMIARALIVEHTISTDKLIFDPSAITINNIFMYPVIVGRLYPDLTVAEGDIFVYDSIPSNF